MEDEHLGSPSSKCTGQNTGLSLAKPPAPSKDTRIVLESYHPKVGVGELEGAGSSRGSLQASSRHQALTAPAGGAMLTPGIAHSPQSFLLMATNCKMHFPETGCVILFPLSSLFHLWAGTQNSQSCLPNCHYQQTGFLENTKHVTPADSQAVHSVSLSHQKTH